MSEVFSRRVFLKAAGLSAVGVTAFGLTGCGGSGSGSGGNHAGTGGGSSGNGGNTGTGSNSGASSGSGSSGTDASKYTSRTVKYFTRQGVMGKNKYVRYYAQNLEWEITEACDGRRRALYGCVMSGSDMIPNVKLMDKKTKWYYEYSSAETPHRVHITTNYSILNDSVVQSLNFIGCDLKDYPPAVADPMTINGVEYYCESVWSGTGLKYFYCFDKKDVEGTKLKYVVYALNKDLISEIYEIREVKAKFDQDLLRMPEGYLVIKDNVFDATKNETTGVDPYPND